MAQRKKRSSIEEFDLILNLKDLLTELKPKHISSAIDWSGKEIVDDAEVGKAIAELIMNEPRIKAFCIGISKITGERPEHIHNSVLSGFIMGMATVVEMLNADCEEAEEPTSGKGPLMTDGPDTVQ